MNPQDLAGRWTIVSWEQRYDDGRVVYPLGERLAGFVHYDNGRMFLVLHKAERPRFTTGGQWNASDAEKARAYDGYMSYGGTYAVEGDEVLHSVEYSLFPNWCGGVQRRRAALKDGLLTLSARLEDGTPEARSANLVWRRA